MDDDDDDKKGFEGISVDQLKNHAQLGESYNIQRSMR